MDPITLTMISLGATALGSGVGALGSIMGGQSALAMYKYRVGMARINADIEKQNANWATHVGDVKAQHAGIQSGAIIGRTRAIQGASNLNVNTGSAAQVQESLHKVGLEEQDIIHQDAAHRAYGHEIRAWQEEAKIPMFEAAAENATTEGFLGAITSILGGASSVSQKWFNASKQGVFS